MALISKRVTDLFGGVSQAPSAARKASQWTELVNSLPVFRKRLGRRPPLLHIAKLSATVPPSGAFEHSVVTSTGRRVHLVVVGGEVSAYDADTGDSISVIAPDGGTYLDASTLKAVSNGDTTVLLNPAQTIRKSASTASPSKKHEALVYVRQGDYSTTYVVTLSGTVFTYTTPDSATGGAEAAITTDQIALQLVTLLLADAAVTTNYYLSQYGSTIYVTRKDGADFTIASSDGIADKGLVLVKGAIQRFADLPPRCRSGVIVEVTGDDSTQFDNYYVQYRGATATDQRGVWVEVVRPGVAVAFDASTLPYRCEFRGNLLEKTAHVDTERLTGTIDSLGLGPSYFEYHLTFAADAVFPVGCPIVVVFDGVTTFTYTVGVVPETAAEVAAGLEALINANPTYTVTRVTPEQLHLQRADSGFFTVATTAGFDNDTTFAGIDELPATLAGYIIENLTDGSSASVTSSTAGTIVVASLAGGLTNRFNDGDVCIVRSSGDYFLVAEAPWAIRKVGDDTTVPFPSVVGKTLSEVFFHQGRLGLTSGNGVLLSRAGDIFNLFRTTATAVLSDDPIDITNALGDTSPFHSAVEWNDALYLFSGLKQYTLDAENQGPITPETVRLRAVSAYPSSSSVRPVTAGNRLYFVAVKSQHTRVLEYTVSGVSQNHEATDTGRHCPTYIEGSPLQLAVDESQGVLLLRTDALSQRSLYVYSFYVEAGEKQAAGWHRWDFAGGTILSISCVEGIVGVIRSFGDGIFLEELLLDPVALASYDDFWGDAGLTFGAFLFGAGNPIGGEGIAYLDRRITTADAGVSSVFSAGVTTWTLPYEVAVDGSEGVLAVAVEKELILLTTTRPAANQIAAVGDYSTRGAHIGVLYTTTWTFSTLYLRNAEGEADERGRLQLRFLRLRYSDSSDLTVTVEEPFRTTRTTTLNADPASGTLVVPIQGQNIAVTITASNATAGAGHIVSYEWEGTYHTRERAL